MNELLKLDELLGWDERRDKLLRDDPPSYGYE